MNRTEFQNWTKHHIRLMDGATGSNLMKAGMPRGVCTEQWVLEHPDAILALQSAYKAAGSDMVYAPTFCANRIALSGYGLQDDVSRMNRELVALSKKAVGSGVLVAGDMTTTGKPADPEDSDGYQQLLDAYREQAEALISAGADLIGVETMMGVSECVAAIEAIRSLGDIAVICTLSVRSDGKCYFDRSRRDSRGAGCGRHRRELLHRPRPAGERHPHTQKYMYASHHREAERWHAEDFGFRRGGLFHGGRRVCAAYGAACRSRRESHWRLLRNDSGVYRSPARA